MRRGSPGHLHGVRSLTPCCGLQVRALLYVGALSNGILEALAHAERAITDAIVTPVPHPAARCRPCIARDQCLQRSNASACS